MLKRRSRWLAGSGALLLTLSLSGMVAAVEPVVTDPVVTADTTATFEDLNGDGIDDDCTAAVETLDQTAVDAESAMRVLATFAPRLILMDIQLPGMDGLQLTRLLRQDPAWRHVRIVALTAYAMKGDEDKALAAGCDAYITKPIDTERLPKVVAEQLAIRR